MSGHARKALIHEAGDGRSPDAPPSDAALLADLRQKYRELVGKHRLLLRRVSRTTAERTGLNTLAYFALLSSDSAVAIADRDQVLFRNARWHALERERTGWRATARDPAAPAEAPTLLHLAIAAARALLARSAPRFVAARYERSDSPHRRDAFDVRFERIQERALVGIAIRDVTRLVTAEREASRARRDLEIVAHERIRRGDPPRSRRGVLPPKS